jgi:hypothetical protein
MGKEEIIINELKTLKENFVNKAKSIGAQITLDKFAESQAPNSSEQEKNKRLAYQNEGSRKTYLAMAMKVQLVIDKIKNLLGVSVTNTQEGIEH